MAVSILNGLAVHHVNKLVYISIAQTSRYTTESLDMSIYT